MLWPVPNSYRLLLETRHISEYSANIENGNVASVKEPPHGELRPTFPIIRA